MPTWNGDPNDFHNEYKEVFNMATELSENTAIGREAVGCDEIKLPERTEFDQEFDTHLAAVLAYRREEEKRLAKLEKAIAEEEAQIEREWEAVSNTVWSFSEALQHVEDYEFAPDYTIRYNGEEIKPDDHGWFIVASTDTAEANGVYTVTTTASSYIEDDDDFEHITVSEFKDFIYDLIQEKGGALPDIDDWKRIKNMLDMMPEDDDYYDDEDDYYGSNEDSILVGEADEPTTLYYAGTAKAETTPDGLKINNPSIGDTFYDTMNNMTLVWTGNNWQDESYRG